MKKTLFVAGVLIAFLIATAATNTFQQSMKTNNRFTTLSVSLPKDVSCENGECEIEIYLCAMTHEEAVNQRQWGKDGYCGALEKGENPLDPNNYYRPEGITRWKRITTAEKEPTESDIQTSFTLTKLKSDFRPITLRAGEIKKIMWNWRADWYRANNCFMPERKIHPICRGVTKSGVYSEETTMYYTLFFSIVQNGKRKIIPSAAEHGKIMSLNYYEEKEDV